MFFEPEAGYGVNTSSLALQPVMYPCAGYNLCESLDRPPQPIVRQHLHFSPKLSNDLFKM